jgi:hypothetical protein
MERPDAEQDDRAIGSETKRDLPPDAAEAMLWCPLCDARLEQHRCKLLCRRCGYYMSCADYY